MFDLTGAATGLWNVVVTNTDGQYATKVNAFNVNSPAPTVSTIAPNIGIRGWPVNIIGITGTNFQPGATVQLRRSGETSVTATNVTVISSSQISCTFDLAAVDPWYYSSQTWTVRVKNDDNQYGDGYNLFTVTNYDPAVTGISPATGSHGTTVTIDSISGTRFQPGATVQLISHDYYDTIYGSNVNIISDTQIACTFNIPYSADTGLYYIEVTNPGGQWDDSSNIFTVTAALAPVVSSISPNQHRHDGNSFYVDIYGTGFQSDATVQVIGGSGSGFTIDYVNVLSTTHMTARFRIPTSASTGYRTIRVRNGDGGSGDLTNGFTVLT
jgi:hypothetical protein